MSRRRKAQERKILPDVKYKNMVIAKFLNCMMTSGKKSIAEKAFYEALDKVAAQLKKDPLEVFLESIDNLKPMVEVRSRRVGGATYQVPVEVRQKRRQFLAIVWMIKAARKRGEKTFRDKLAGEILAAYNKSGEAYKVRENTHKMADANKAFSHYRW